MYLTYKFLFEKFSESQEDLDSLGISLENLMLSVIGRLSDQIKEVGNSERKLKNGKVISLSKFTDKGFEFLEIPYYAFACTNVSLDMVMVKNNKGSEYSLREIDSMLGSKNKHGNFFLPNSLEVSVSLSSHNLEGETVFVSQERNNSTILSQNINKQIASASGSVPCDLIKSKGGNLGDAIDVEIREELGIESIQLSQKEIIYKVKTDVDSIIKGNKKSIHGIKSLLVNTMKGRLKNELGTEIINSGTILVGLGIVRGFRKKKKRERTKYGGSFLYVISMICVI